jgi:hypothetical protein
MPAPTKCIQIANMTARKPPKLTLTAIIRSRVPTYKARQWAGESQKTFAQELTDEGHPTSYAQFRVLYSRVRIQLRKKEALDLQPKQENPKIAPRNEEREIQEAVPSHDPKDLDAIVNNSVDLAALAKSYKKIRK